VFEQAQELAQLVFFVLLQDAVSLILVTQKTGDKIRDRICCHVMLHFFEDEKISDILSGAFVEIINDESICNWDNFVSAETAMCLKQSVTYMTHVFNTW